MKILSQNNLRSLFSLYLLLFSAPCFAENPVVAPTEETSVAVKSNVAGPEIQWAATFSRAAELAKQQKKPIFIYFSGSDWCSWCQKMESEILSSPEFVAEIGPKFIFYKADFPVYKELEKPLAEKNEELKKAYNVVGFPTIILVTPDQVEFAKLNYREGGGKAYAEYLQKLLKEQETFENGMSNIKKENLSSLQSMYERAYRLNLDAECTAILKEGCSRGDIAYFMKERYKDLLDEGKMDSQEAHEIKARILALDPSNKRRLHYDVALIEFEALSKHLSTDTEATRAVKPLQDYLAAYGNKDLKTRWKIEMIIAQTLASKNQVDDALSYAQASQQHAPPRHKTSCGEVVADLTKQQTTANFIAHEDE